MEKQTLALVPGSTTRFAVVDSERDLGFTIEGTFRAKIPKGGGKAGEELEVVFVAEHVYPNDPLWDGQGKPPSQIKAEAARELQEQLEAGAEARREAAQSQTRPADKTN